MGKYLSCDLPFFVSEKGTHALNGIIRSGLNSRGEFEINLTEGTDRFTNKVLFIASECNTKTEVEHQKKQMKFFPDVEIAVINNSGHEMFTEHPEESIRIVGNILIPLNN